MPHDDRFDVPVRGSRTAVFGYGDQDQPCILAVHGFRGTHGGLEPLAVALAESGHRVLVPDLPGAGQSSPLAGCHDAAGYGDWLRDLAAAVGSPGTLLGHSFGTIIVSAAVARGIPHERVVFVNPIASPVLDSTNRAGTALVWLYYALAQALPKNFRDVCWQTRRSRQSAANS